MLDSLVLIVEDAGLRSALTARLGLAGETVHVAADPGDPALSAAHRDMAILIVEEDRLPRGGLEAARGSFWPGRIIVLGDGQPLDLVDTIRIARAGAARRVAEVVAAWRRGENPVPQAG